MEVEVIRQTGHPKTWWDCAKDDMESLSCPERMRSLGIHGERESRGQTS